MEAEFWHERWKQNLIGFHQTDINTHLTKYIDSLELQPGQTVFVPLCGKSLDMGWLAEQGYKVAGVEISPLAIADFFSEAGHTPERVEKGPCMIWRSGGIQIFCGDFFALTPELLPSIDAVYDRAALIAFPQHMRKPYVHHLTGLLKSGTRCILITLEFDEHEMQGSNGSPGGPPFSVEEAEVQTLYQEHFEIERLVSENVLEKNAHFQERGLSRLQEKAYLLNKK